MHRHKQRGFHRSEHLTFSHPWLPEYPLPKALNAVLDIEAKSALSRTSQMYSKVLEILSTVKYVDLSESHYIQLLKLALYLEEFHSNEEMKKRKKTNQKIEKLPPKYQGENLFKIRVKDLDEERPWIRENDFVDVIDTKTQRLYTLKVTYVTKTDIIASDEFASLCNVFKPLHLYDINFRFQNYPLRCNHYALGFVYKQNVITYLFPDKSKSFITMESKSYRSLQMLNQNIETNPEQKQAVVNILNKSAFPAPYILYGPPGTGKTATLVEAICQINKASPLNHILVCTPSNTAADEVAKRLLKFLPAHKILRIYSLSKNKSTVDKELKDCSYCGGGVTRPDIVGKRILISTLCTAIRFQQMDLSPGYFSHIIIDEAGQGTEPDILIPISIASKNGKLYSQVVLAGDPQQLGPTVTSKLADIILGRSILERLMSYDTYKRDISNKYNPKYITKLLNNYRSHPSIIHISNKLFYDNELIPKIFKEDQTERFPVIFHGVEGVEEKFSYSPSTYNKKEIDEVLNYVQDLIENKTEFGDITAKDIGIVTPFTLQSKHIKNILKAKDDEEKKKENITNKQKKKKKNLKILRNEKMKNDDQNIASTSTDIQVEIKKNEDAIVLKVIVENEEDEVKINPELDNLLPQTDDAKIKLKNKNKSDTKIDTDKTQIKFKNLKDINVGTVELFQGQERKIMIMTAVRSKTFVHNGKEHIGFLSNPKRFNVAMSRAKDALIVVGNPNILQKDGMWYYLLKYCIENKSYRGLKFELKDSYSEKLELSETESIETSISLFKQEPFKLFVLDGADSPIDVMKTIDLFVEPEKVNLENEAELHETLKKWSLS